MQVLMLCAILRTVCCYCVEKDIRVVVADVGYGEISIVFFGFSIHI